MFQDLFGLAHTATTTVAVKLVNYFANLKKFHELGKAPDLNHFKNAHNSYHRSKDAI